MHRLHAFFEPKAVALIGASADEDKLSGRPLRFLKEAGFSGRIYPVNPKSSQIQGLQAYPDLDSVPDDVDHAIIVLPAAAVEDAVLACARKGIKAVQIFTAGFAELGGKGAERQARLVAIAREHSMRLLGPNCLGIVSVCNGFFATFSTALEALTPSPGSIGLATQSGAFGSCAYATAIQRGIGLSRIVATGNEADIDVAECIDYLAHDPQTRVICVAIEGCQNGPRLRAALSLAARLGKPVVAMKVGSSEVGAAAAASHTGSLAGNDAVYDTVFAECGAYRARTIEEMLDVAVLCSVGGLARNRNVGIVTLSGGIGVLMADQCETLGLSLPALPAEAGERIQAVVPFAAVGNPMDTTAQVAAVPGGLVSVASLMLDHTDWGTVFLYLAQKAAAPKKFESTLRDLQALRERHPDRLIVLVGPSDEGVRKDLERIGLVMMTDPNRAVAAAAAAAASDERREQIEEVAAARTPSRPLPERIDEVAAKRLLADYGLPMLEEVLCTSADQARQAAVRLGFPVVAKIVSPDIAHKTEIGGVMLNLADEDAVSQAFDAILARARAHMPQARIEGILISPQQRDGVELILGVQNDPIFGPMVMCGLGGVAVELYRDVVFGSAPLSPARAEGMISRLRCSPLLHGWRGAQALDVPALVNALCRLSSLAAEHAEDVDSIEVNPFLLQQRAGVCLDALLLRRERAEALG